MGVTFELCLEVRKFYAKAEDLDELYASMCILNGLLSLTAIVGNMAMIYALQKASSIPTTSRILMQSLAATDLSVGVLGHPLYIAVIAGIRQSYGCENIHEILMVFFILSASLVVVSFQLVTFIGVDRFLAITLHLRYNELVTPKRVVILVAGVWVCTLSSVFITVFCFFQAGEIVMVVCGYVLMLLLSIVYMKVYFVARRHQASINSQAQSSRRMDTKMKSGKSVLRNLFIITFLFIPFVLTNAVISLLRKVRAYVHSELKTFNDIYGDKTVAEPYTDSAFIAYIKGEETVQGVCCPQRKSDIVETRGNKSTTQQTNDKKAYKGKKSTSTSKKRIKRRINIQPPPVEELILRGSIADCRTENVDQRFTEVPRQELSGEIVAKTLKNTSATKEVKGKREIHHHCLCVLNAVVNALLFTPQKIRAYVQRVLEEFSDISQDSMADLPYTEPAFIAYLKGEEAAPFVCSPHITFSKSGCSKQRD
ncbi:hypothetical protein ACROYT_G006304 [Oculina patagonica]